MFKQRSNTQSLPSEFSQQVSEQNLGLVQNLFEILDDGGNVHFGSLGYGSSLYLALMSHDDGHSALALMP